MKSNGNVIVTHKFNIKEIMLLMNFTLSVPNDFVIVIKGFCLLLILKISISSGRRKDHMKPRLQKGRLSMKSAWKHTIKCRWAPLAVFYFVLSISYFACHVVLLHFLSCFKASFFFFVGQNTYKTHEIMVCVKEPPDVSKLSHKPVLWKQMKSLPPWYNKERGHVLNAWRQNWQVIGFFWLCFP